MSSQVSTAPNALRRLKNKLVMLKRMREKRKSDKSEDTAEEKIRIKDKLAALARKINQKGNQ